MKMTMRWFGEGDDSVTLQQMKQIPNLQGIAGGLHHIPVGDIWPREEIAALVKTVQKAGLALEVIESVNIHEEIKLGSPKRDRYIDNYIQTIRNLAEFGVKVICYNFMPVFDWTRSSIDKELPDGSRVMDYNEGQISRIQPDKIAEYMMKESREFSFPGWEPEKLAVLGELFERYKGVSEESLRSNLQYFLQRIIPVCEETGVSMAIHPDDPPWNIFGLPRIARNQEDFDRIIELVDSPANGITLCTGCLGACRTNDIPGMIRHFAEKNRIHFAHIRNIQFYGEKDFYEVSHFTGDGYLDMFEIVKALYDSGFKGYARPDHGRMIWNEKARPGYGLYDRALGITYINGLWEALNRLS